MITFHDTRLKAVLLALAGLVAGAMLPNTSAAQSVKMAVVDLNRAMNEVEEGKAAVAKLEKRFNQRREELAKKEKEIQDLRADLDLKSAVLTEEARKDRATEIQEKSIALQQAQFEAEQEMNGLRNQMQSELADKLQAVVAELAKKHGYTVVLEKAVTWYSELPDMTDELIQAYNAKHKPQ